MSHQAEPGDRSAPDFVPDTWLVELEADARELVHVRARHTGRPWGSLRVWAVSAAVVAAVAACVASMVWAMTAEPIAAVWLVGGIWFLVAVLASIWVGYQVDNLLDR